MMLVPKQIKCNLLVREHISIIALELSIYKMLKSSNQEALWKKRKTFCQKFLSGSGWEAHTCYNKNNLHWHIKCWIHKRKQK